MCVLAVRGEREGWSLLNTLETFLTPTSCWEPPGEGATPLSNTNTNIISSLEHFFSLCHSKDYLQKILSLYVIKTKNGPSSWNAKRFILIVACFPQNIREAQTTQLVQHPEGEIRFLPRKILTLHCDKRGLQYPDVF